MQRFAGPLATLSVPACALVLALFRPGPMRPPESHSSVTVMDGRGHRVPIQQPFRGAVLYAGIVMPDYVLVSQAPGTILDTFAFNDRHAPPTLLDRRFPQLATVPTVVFKRAASVETMLLQRPGAVLTWNATASQLENVGLPAVGLRVAAEADLFQRAGIYAALTRAKGRDTFLHDLDRAEDEALRQELRPETIAVKKRVLMLNRLRPGGALTANNSHASVWRRAGCVEAASRLSGTIDAESVLAIDPDIVIASGVLTPQNIVDDPVLQHLRAVRERRVYVMPHGIAAFAWNILDLPLYSRWLAELAYPDRLPPKVGSQMRQVYHEALGFEASDADLDQALRTAENAF